MGMGMGWDGMKGKEQVSVSVGLKKKGLDGWREEGSAKVIVVLGKLDFD